MSNSLTTLVPVFDGANWTAWCDSIQAYLMSQGQWYTVEEESPTTPDADTSNDDRTAYKAWKVDNLRAIGNINLRCAPSVRQHVKGITNANILWTTLKSDFGKPGVAAIFAEFRAAIELLIPVNQNPQATIQKLNAHFERLADFDIKIAPFLHGMLLAMKAPAYADVAVQIAQNAASIEEVSPKTIGQSMINAWEQRQGRRKETSLAARITAVKRTPGEPSFQQQQQSQPPLQQRFGNRQIRRGKRNAREPQDHANGVTATPSEHAHFASMATVIAPSTPSLSAIPPSVVPLASRIEGYRAVEPSDSQYPRLQRAIALTNDLGVPPSFERIRVLEQVLDDDEPTPPAKKLKVEQEMINHVAPPDTTVVDDVDDAVSLDDEDDLADELLKSIGYDEKSVHSSAPCRDALTPSICLGTMNWCDSLHPKPCISTPNTHCLPMTSCATRDRGHCLTASTWMLDSGASAHFTFERRDLTNYRLVDHHVHTANGVATAVGVGDTTIRYARSDGSIGACNLTGVFYMPDLKERLLSLGLLLLDGGMHVTGHAGGIALHHPHSEDAMMFSPVQGAGTVFLLDTVPVLLAPAVLQPASSHVSFDVAHRRFAHPSPEVLRHFISNTEGAPRFAGPPPAGLCSGCAQGKMPLRSFPPTHRRATHPFELIHSDLKSFPVESYYSQRYAIIYFDDFTSFAWVSLLRRKNDALTTTRDFLAMVNTQFTRPVQQWMSDAGGEYKSDAFDAMLRQHGVCVLQSAPHTPQQNGRAERFMRTMMDKGEAMRHTACIPPSWWNFTVEHAVHVYNRTPMHRLHWRTPFQALHK